MITYDRLTNVLTTFHQRTHLPCNALDSFKVANRSNRKTSFNHINTKARKLLSNDNFFIRIERYSRRLYKIESIHIYIWAPSWFKGCCIPYLFAISQAGIKDNQFLLVDVCNGHGWKSKWDWITRENIKKKMQECLFLYGVRSKGCLYSMNMSGGDESLRSNHIGSSVLKHNDSLINHWPPTNAGEFMVRQPTIPPVYSWFGIWGMNCFCVKSSFPPNKQWLGESL